jgi:hypothetical protein
VKEEPEVILKSEPPSPDLSVKKEPDDSFLKEVFEGAKGLNIDLSTTSLGTPITSPLLQVKKPEVTVARSHTVAAQIKSKL